jgi:hypothetical protein
MLARSSVSPVLVSRPRAILVILACPVSFASCPHRSGSLAGRARQVAGYLTAQAGQHELTESHRSSGTRVPASDRRSPPCHRLPVGRRGSRGRPQAPRRHRQRGFRGVLGIPPTPRALPRPPGPRPGQIRPHRPTGWITAEGSHPNQVAYQDRLDEREPPETECRHRQGESGETRAAGRHPQRLPDQVRQDPGRQPPGGARPRFVLRWPATEDTPNSSADVTAVATAISEDNGQLSLQPRRVRREPPAVPCCGAASILPLNRVNTSWRGTWLGSRPRSASLGSGYRDRGRGVSVLLGDDVVLDVPDAVNLAAHDPSRPDVGRRVLEVAYAGR